MKYCIQALFVIFNLALALKGPTFKWSQLFSNSNIKTGSLTTTGTRTVSEHCLSEVIAVGKRLPLDVSLQILIEGKATSVPIAEILSGKKAVIVGVPGSFTKTCSKHLKGFKEHHQELLDFVDMVICISVNDAYVTDAWKRDLEYDGILMLADGNAQFAKKTGLAMDTGSFGGIRLNRCSMIVNDGVVCAIAVDKDGANSGICSAESLVTRLKSKDVF